MHLRFRAVVPYTLPGVLALIGWWWYTSRKKERFISQVGSEGPPSAESIKTIQTDDRNGLVDKDNGLSPHEEDISNCRPQNLGNRGTQQELIAQIHISDTEATTSAKTCEDASHFSGRNQGEEVISSNFALLSSNKENVSEDLRKTPKDPDKDSSLVPSRQLEEHFDKDLVNASEASVEVKQSHHSTKAISASSTAAHLFDAERPEPEGEVATHQNTAQTPEVMALTPTKVHRVVQPEADSLESALSTDLHNYIFTSTPTALTFPVQDSSTPWQTSTSEDIQMEKSTREEPNLELLAAGLITEVISAATQEVLGVTSCKVSQKNQVSTSSCVLLTSEKQCSHEEPIPAIQQHSWHLRDCGEVVERQGVSVSSCIATDESTDRVHETNGTQSSSRPTQLHQATTLLTSKRRRNEDSICSTCHSEDGVSSEGLQSSVSESQADLIQVTDLSPRDAVQLESMVETMTEAAEEDSVCVIRRPNGIGSRDGAQRTCEVDTDQSGGETFICLLNVFSVSPTIIQGEKNMSCQQTYQPPQQPLALVSLSPKLLLI